MKILVAYESKHGSTKAIAERIAVTLARHHHQAVAVGVGRILDPAGYDAYVIGSAVYYGRWMNEAIEFVKVHEGTLAQKPVWLFSSGPVGTSRPADPIEIDRLRQWTKARDHHVFYGALDRSKLSIGERLVVGAVKAPDGDVRDWADIESWAENIAYELREAAAPVTA